MPNQNQYFIPKENVARVEEVREVVLEQRDEYDGYEINNGILTITYKLGEKYRFNIDGDLRREFKVSGSSEYVSYYLRNKLREFENGQIEVIRKSTGKRDWEYEEKIRKRLWEDVNVNRRPHGYIARSLGCEVRELTMTNYSSPRKGGICKIS